MGIPKILVHSCIHTPQPLKPQELATHSLPHLIYPPYGFLSAKVQV